MYFQGSAPDQSAQQYIPTQFRGCPTGPKDPVIRYLVLDNSQFIAAAQEDKDGRNMDSTRLAIQVLVSASQGSWCIPQFVLALVRSQHLQGLQKDNHADTPPTLRDLEQLPKGPGHHPPPAPPSRP